jgi:hypothetical protein
MVFTIEDYIAWKKSEGSKRFSPPPDHKENKDNTSVRGNTRSYNSNTNSECFSPRSSDQSIILDKSWTSNRSNT